MGQSNILLEALKRISGTINLALNSALSHPVKYLKYFTGGLKLV